MLMIREILGYCIISAICLLGMAGLCAPVCFLLRNRVPPEPKKIAQTAANVVMFVPLGVMMPVAFRRMRSFGKTALSLALFSFAIEFTQYFTGRSADIDDLMLNTLGGMLGYLIFFVVSKLFWKKRPRRTNRAYHRSVRKS